MCHDSFTLTGCQYVGTQTNDATWRYFKGDIHTLTFCIHTKKFALTTSYHINHLTWEVGRNIDSQFLNRLTFLTINLLIDYLWLTNLQLIAFATHCLNENREMEYATSTNNPLIHWILHRKYTECEVFLKFLAQTVADVARSTELTFLSEERRVVDGEEHTHCRLVNSDWWQWLWVLKISDSITNFKLLQTDYCTNIARVNSISLLMSHTLKGMQFLDSCAFLWTITVTNSNILSVLQCTTMYTTNGDTSCIAWIVQRSNQHLWCSFNLLRSRNSLNNKVKQILNIIRLFLPVLTHPAVLSWTINNREVQLIFCSVKVAHEVEHHLIYFLWTTVRFVYLIDDNNRFQAKL